MKLVSQIIWAGLLLSSGTVWAQFPDTLPVVEVRASVIEATPLQTIRAEDLVREEGLSLVPALNRQSGILVHSGALNTNRITIRGIGSRTPFGTSKIRAYLDEIPLTNGVGETVLEDIDPSVIRRVDILKGPASSRYGAGLGGLIHLKTLNHTAYEDSYAGSSLSLGSYGLQHHTHQLHTMSADQTLGIHLSAQRVHSDGWRENSQYERLGGMLLSRWTPDERQQLTLLAGAWRLKGFIPSSLNLEDFRNNPERAAPNWAAMEGFEQYDRQLAGVSHQYQWTDQWRSVVSVFSQYRRSYEPRPFNILREQSRSLGARFLLGYESPHDRTWQQQAHTGLELFSENHLWQTNVILPGTAPGALLSDLEEQRRYLNAFADYQLQRQRWVLEAGLNANLTGYDLTDRFFPDSLDLSGVYRFDPVLSPRLSAAYELWPAWQTQVYGLVRDRKSVV
jgi:iron complex outermembrane receptor protein